MDLLQTEILIVIALIMAYLLGSFSSAIVIAKLMNLPDPRLSGSKNAGATNMNRLYGKTPAILTLLVDGLKGLLAVLIAQFFHLDLFWQISTGLIVIVGHIYPIFFGFKGGKGVATYLGVLLGFYLPSFVIFALSWLIIAKVFKISSLSALCASFMTLISCWFIFYHNIEVNLVLSLITLLIFYTHRANMKRFISKQEY